MEIKKYLDQAIDLPKMLSDKLPWNCWNSCVSDSEKSIPGWINLFAKLIALAVMLGAVWGSLNYLIATQQGDQVFTDEMVMTEQIKEGTGMYVEDEWVPREWEEVPLLDDEGNNVYEPAIEDGDYVYEKDLVMFNTGWNEEEWKSEFEFLGMVGYLLAFLFWLYALFPVVNVIRDAGEEIASSNSNMILFLFKDIPLALIRAAGYIAALLALFAALALAFSWLTSIDLGSSDNVWGGAGEILSGLNEFSNLGIMGIASLMGMFEIFGSINPEEMMGMLEGTMSSTMSVEWLSISGLTAVILGFWNVVVILIGLFVNLILWKWIIALATTFVNWISGPYLPFKSLK